MTDEKTGYKPTQFSEFLRGHMDEWCNDGARRPIAWARWEDGIYAAYWPLAKRAVRADSVRLHEYAAHILNSQAFAFNLFLPFREGNREKLSKRISELVGVPLTINRVNVEWVPPGGLLGELVGVIGEWPMVDGHATGADVALWGRLENHRRAVVLAEAKLSEGGFTHCGGRTSRGNRRKDVCRSSAIFLNDPDACYLRRPWGKQRGRRYWEIFSRSHGSVRDAFPHPELGGPYLFANDMQQPMRNYAIARSLEQEDLVERAWFALCAHDANP